MPRDSLKRTSRARRRVAESIELDAIGPALAELVGASIELAARPDGNAKARERFAEVTLALGTTTVGVWVSPDLATALLGRVLGRSLTLERDERVLDPVLLGALGALAVEVARRSAREPVALSTPLTSAYFSVDVTVRVERQTTRRVRPRKRRGVSGLGNESLAR